MPDRIFYAAGVGFLVGVLWRSFYFVNFYFAVLLGLVAFAIILFFALAPRYGWGAVAAVFIFSFTLGILRFGAADTAPPLELERRVGAEVTLVGILSDEPAVRENNQHLILFLKGTKILLIAGLEEEYRYGDEVKFTGQLEKPENFITDQGREFDYANYLRKDGVFYTVAYPEIEMISRGHGNTLRRALFAVKNKFLEKINAAIPVPESILMGGLILGERASFSGELREDFVRTGTIHIVALSGYNVSIVSDWIMKFLSFAPRAFAFGGGMLAILLFVLMTGAGATAVRAGIMAVLVLIARATGRSYDVARALLFAGAAMVLLNPHTLRYDVSFQLSFLATVAVIFLTPRVEKYFQWVTPRFGLREIFSMTTAAYLLVLPVILYKMGNLSLVALPANVLILPFIPLTMALGFFTGLAGIIYGVLAVPLGFVAYLFLRYELGAVQILSGLPFAAANIQYFPLFLTLLVYAALAYYLFGRSIKDFFSSHA